MASFQLVPNQLCLRFEIDIEAKESRSSHRAKATVNLWVFEPAQQIKMIINKDPMMEFYKDAETDEMSKIFRIIYGHGIMICGEEDLYNIKEGGLYHNFSLINHSCLPNASCSWVMGDFRRTQVRAFKDIEKDEEILIAYHGAATKISCGSREFRRQQILENKGFVCECSECSLEGEALEASDRERAEVKEKGRKLLQMLNFQSF